MVFGFFTRQPQVEKPQRSAADAVFLVQLRTPSPSESASVANAPPRSTTPTLSVHGSEGNTSRQRFSPFPSETLLAPPPLEAESTIVQAEPIDRQDLITLIKSVPPKILHAYVLGHLPSASPSELVALSTFLETLAPPPKLHCVRCHKNYVEVENDDRSCLVPHDDDSAEVEMVARSSKGGQGAQYETLWGCCAKTVDGDGDLGPPDGWCYEGKHTTDLKRARFRADSTPHDDRLQSCVRLNCFGERPVSKRLRSTRTRPRRSLEEASGSDAEEKVEEKGDAAMEDAEMSDGTSLAASVKGKTTKSRGRKGDGDAVSVNSAGPSTKAKGKGKGKARATKVEGMKLKHQDDDEEGEVEKPKKKRKVA